MKKLKLLVVVFPLLFSVAEGYLFSTPPHSNVILGEFKYDHVLSVDDNFRNQIIKMITAFPQEDYDVYHVPGLGLFFLDRKPDWIKDFLKREWKWEPHIEPLINTYTKPGSIVIDAGAHIGTQTLLLASAVGPEGKVLAFEPQPKTFVELFMNSEINKASNIYCYWAALLDKPGEIELPVFFSECEVVNLFDFSYGHSGVIAPVITLDSLQLKDVSLIKVDIDGCEDAFLDGARNTILENRPVLIIEILGGANFDTATPEECAKILHTQAKIIELGYELQRVGIHDYLALPIEE